MFKFFDLVFECHCLAEDEPKTPQNRPELNKNVSPTPNTPNRGSKRKNKLKIVNVQLSGMFDEALKEAWDLHSGSKTSM